MVKIEYPFSKLQVVLDTMANICPNNVIKPTLSEVLQSDPVKRLFNQPNLVIKTIPFKPLVESNNTIWCKRNGMNSTSNHIKPSEISILPVRTANEEQEDANLLPSKTEHKKSEIALLPIEKKSCGHYEQCENIVCDVTLQQYADKDGVSPMLALNIEEDEINAPVEKHCGNKYCDALSIDHNRCRRALIKLHRCDKSYVCDICGVTLKRSISRIHHRNCARKKEYIHNDVDRSHLLKERMRMRELQILENAKMKKHNYSDPDKAMEILRKNEELLIIPQKASSQRSVVTMTSVPSAQLTSTNLINVQPIKINSHITKATNVFENVPLTVSPQNTIIIGNKSCLESKVTSTSQVRLSNLQQKSYLGLTSVPSSTPAPVQTQIQVPVSTSTPTVAITLAPISASTPVTVSTPTSVSTSSPVSSPASVPTLTLTLARTPTPTSVPSLTPISTPNVATTSASTLIGPQHKQYIRLTVSPQTTTVQPVTMNNWIVSPSRILPTASAQPKAFLAPVRVVPIANLISPPSLLHRTQGIPKFCIVAENLVTPVTIPKSPVTTPNSPSVQPTAATADTATAQKNASNLSIQNSIPKVRKTQKAKKNFFCVYCSKNITTDWYFKMHIAKHKGEKLFFCNYCDESFSNNYDMKKHVTNQHIGQKGLTCNKCGCTCTSLASLKSHIQTHTISNLDKTDVHSKKQKKLKRLKDKKSHKLIHNSYKRKVKGTKCEDVSDSPKKQIEKRNIKKLSTINDDDVGVKEFTFVSVDEIVKPESFEQESAIISR